MPPSPLRRKLRQASNPLDHRPEDGACDGNAIAEQLLTDEVIEHETIRKIMAEHTVRPGDARRGERRERACRAR